MTRIKLLNLTLILAALLLGLHFLAIKFYLYWTSDWYDTVMHFLGGMVLALFAISLWKGKIKVLVFVAVLAVAWEIFEYLTGISVSKEGYVLDTFLDLVLGMGGATA